MTKRPIKSKPPSISKGDVFTVRDGECVVLRYKDARNVKVRFTATGYVTVCHSGALRKGNVKDPLAPSLVGVGCFGVGPYQGSYTDNGKKVRTRHYTAWQSMLIRCYSGQPKFATGYAGCTVSKRWRNFQNFAHDIEQMPNWDTPGYELDKDIIKPGNKVYSRKHCCFVPREINGALVRSYSGGGATIMPNGKWRARVSKGYGKGMIHLGCFDTREEALAVYAEGKRKRIRTLARIHKNQLDPRAYKALRRFRPA